MAKPLRAGEAASAEDVNKTYDASQERHNRERLLAILMTYSLALEGMGIVLFNTSFSVSIKNVQLTRSKC